MRSKIFVAALFAAVLCCSFTLSAQSNKDKPKQKETFGQKLKKARKIFDDGEKIVSPVIDVLTNQDEPEQEEKGGSEAQAPEPEASQTPGTNSHASKTVIQKPSTTSGQNNGAATLSPGASKTASINGASTSLSNSMADYTIKVTDCRGSKSDQSVTIYFTVQHGLADQYLAVRASHSKAVAGGISYNKFSTKVGGKNNNNTVPYEVEMNCEAIIKSVPPSVQFFSTVSVDLYTKNKGSNSGTKTGKLELRNLKVAWQ